AERDSRDSSVGPGTDTNMASFRRRVQGDARLAALHRFDVYEVLEKAPSCVIVADEQANVVFENAAARTLTTAMTARHGDVLAAAVHDSIAAVAAGTHTFPLTRTVIAHTQRGQAHADLTIDRLGSGFVVSWADASIA